MRLIIALLLVTLSLGAFASELEIIDLRHRSASELIPILQPMLDGDGAITGKDYTLFVRTSPGNLEEIKRLIRQLDTAPLQLLITVEQAGSQQADRSGVGISANSSIPRVDAHIYNDRRNSNDNVGQQLRVLEGQWATIRAGTAVPLQTQRYRYSGSGGYLEQHIEYHDVDSGFEVRPRIHGDQVTLDIRPFRANQISNGRGAIETQSLSTTVTGRLGQWLEVGGTKQGGSQNQSGILYSTTRQKQENNTVRLKVEQIND